MAQISLVPPAPAVVGKPSAGGLVSFPLARPRARFDRGPREPRDRVAYRRSFRLLGAAALVLVLGVGFGLWLDSVGRHMAQARTLMVASALLACGVALVGAGLAAVGFRHGVRLGALERKSLWLGALAFVSNLLMSAVGAFTALLSVAAFARGRQLRHLGRVQLATLEAGDKWLAPKLGALPPRPTTAPEAPAVDEALRAPLAAAWRDNGRTEHASVAAFARLSLDLMALGAPAWLVASAHADALDEVRHAEACFSLAAGFDGQAVSPAAFPAAVRARTLPATRTLALAVLAVDSLIDGALHEGVSARVVARLARTCPEPTIRALLKQIAVDEGRHAAHGWDVVEFCLTEGGEPVAQALRGALTKLPSRLQHETHPVARTGAWERYGLPGLALEQEEFGKARADLIRRLSTLIGARVERVATIAN